MAETPPSPAAEGAPPPPGPSGPVDPAGFGEAVARLGFGSKRAAKTAAAIASALLDEAERLEGLVAGRYLDETAVAVFTGGRVLIVNDREWKPDVVEIEVTDGLTVQGWQDDKTASLTFVYAEERVVIDRIAEREMAREMAGAIRARLGQ